MNENDVRSLCAVISTKSGTPMLYRIADLDEGVLHEFVLDDSAAYEHYNKDIIFHPTNAIPPIGTVGLWDWYSYQAYDDKYEQRSNAVQDMTWIEYIKIEDIGTITELKDRLINGIPAVTGDHDYLFEFDCIGSMHKCVFCAGRDFSSAGQVSVLRDSIKQLSVYSIYEEDIGLIDTWRIPGVARKYYKHIPLGKCESKVPLRAPAAIVKERILTRIKLYSPEMTKADRRSVRNFLDIIANTTLAEDIAVECQCDISTAQTYLNDFLVYCEQYFTNEDIGTELLTRIITNDSEIALRFKALARKDWEAEQVDILAEATAKINDKENTLASLQETLSTYEHKLEEVKNEIASAHQELVQMETQRQRQLQLADDTSEAVRQKIIAAKDDVVTFLSDYALFAGTGEPSVSKSSDTDAEFISAVELSDDPYQVESLKDLHECLCENLEVAGIKDKHMSILAAYLIAAYATKTPLILAGYGAISIADALSATINNQIADRMFCFGKSGIPQAVNKTTGHIVAVYDAFQGNCMSKLFNLTVTAQNYYCFIVPTSQELSVEPRGLYDYALPLFTEYFVDRPATCDWGGSISNIVATAGKGPKAKTLLPEHIVSPYTYLRCKTMLDYLSALIDDSDIYHSTLLQTLPIMASLGSQEKFVELIEASKLSDDEKEEFLTLIGEPT